MTPPIFRPHLVTALAGALLALASGPAGHPWAAESPSTSKTSASQKDAAHERAAVNAIGRARYSAQNRRARDLIDQIERAETALLNVGQIGRDPQIDSALQHLDAARALAASNDLRAAEVELMLATADVAMTLAMADPDMTTTDAPVVGYAVYDAGGEKIGDVTEVVFDPDGNVAFVVVGVGGFLGTGDKNVAVPPSEATKGSDRLTVDRSKEQLQQAKDYQLPDYGAAAGSSSPPVPSKAGPGPDGSSR
jgi:sporulation protein YlmC with PRC-barrel domain